MTTSNISSYEQQAIDFLNATNTSFVAKYKTYGPHFKGETQSRSIFTINLKNDLGSYTFTFGQSIAAGNETPTAYDVLACLTKNDPESFEDFCDNYGYSQYNEDTGRRNMVSWRTYCAVLKEWNAIYKLFTYEQIEMLQEIQ